jgi:hypothetical protein
VLINRRLHAARECHILLVQEASDSFSNRYFNPRVGLTGRVLAANLVAAAGENSFEEMRPIARAVEGSRGNLRPATSAPRDGSTLAGYARAARAFKFGTRSHRSN